MLAYVKFLSDNSFSIVPVENIEGFDPTKWSSRTAYLVFWSPDEKASKPTEREFRKEANDNKAGFYKALVLKLSETEEEMELALDKSRVRVASTKLVEDPSVSHEKDKQGPSKRQESKAAKQLKKEGGKKNIKGLLEMSSKKRKSLFQDNSDSDSDVSVLQNSDDDVVPKKIHTDLMKKYSSLKNEFNDYRSRKDKRLKELSQENQTLRKLNIELQTKLLMPATTVSSTDEVRTEWTTPKSQAININRQTPSSLMDLPLTTSAKTIGETEISSVETEDTSVTTHPEEPFVLSKDKLELARQVKKGKAGDSLFAKNLLSVFWDPDTLEKRSVTGRKCNALKDATPKQRMTPQKMDMLKSKK